ncbi:MAG: metallophosphoesterase family protein [Gammaproteobacteria bacterium]
MKTKLSGLFSPRQKIAYTVPQVAADTRVYSIGDIHGRDDLLAVMHRLILRDAADFSGRKVAVYLGDYIDRGLNSKDVIERLLSESLPQFENIYLCGNHEQSLQLFLRFPDTGIDWMSYGGQATLYSYGVKMQGLPLKKAQLLDIRQQLQELLPEAHRHFYNALQLTHCEGDYFFVHAGVRPGVALQRQREEDLLWIREDFTNSNQYLGKTVVHGHTVTAQPEFRSNRIGIDTGAYFSGNLTCLVLQGEEHRLITARLDNA